MKSKGRYISPEEYRKLFPGVGVETIKRMLACGKLNGFIDEDPDKKFKHYHILLDENNQGGYSKEYTESLIVENARLKEKLRLVNSVSTL